MFGGLSIDNNWPGDYMDQGWFGVIIDVALVLVLILLAVIHRRGVRRAVALFLVTYFVVASITETGWATQPRTRCTSSSRRRC